MRADLADIGRVVDGEAVGQLHERGGGAGLSGVDGAGDVVDGDGLVNELGGSGVVQMQGARVAELGETGVVLLGGLEQFGIGNGGGNHLAAFFSLSDGKDLYAGARGLKLPEVLVDILGIGQVTGRAGDVAEDRGRGWDGLGGGKIGHDGRQEGRVCRVLFDGCRVALVDGLGGVAGVVGVERLGRSGERRDREGRKEEEPGDLHAPCLEDGIGRTGAKSCAGQDGRKTIPTTVQGAG